MLLTPAKRSMFSGAGSRPGMSLFNRFSRQNSAANNTNDSKEMKITSEDSQDDPEDIMDTEEEE